MGLLDDLKALISKEEPEPPVAPVTPVQAVAPIDPPVAPVVAPIVAPVAEVPPVVVPEPTVAELVDKRVDAAMKLLVQRPTGHDAPSHRAEDAQVIRLKKR